MGLYQDWEALTQQERPHEEQQKLWNDYFASETENYKAILADHTVVPEGTLAELAQHFSMDPVIFAGFLDGINTSLKTELNLEKLKESTKIKLDIDFEKLYYNMLAAKAPWLYGLEEWDNVLTQERRHEITKEFRAAQMYIKPETVGRNDPCPCGSGKKYKKCCGK